MLFQRNLRKLEVVPALGIIAFVAMAMAAVPVAGAEVAATAGEDVNVVSERGERWFFANGLLVGPVVPETPKSLEDCEADGSVSVGAGEAVSDPGCPEYVMGDDFKEYDYGENGIGVTMCKLDATESETITRGVSIGGTIKKVLNIDGGVSVSRTRNICRYTGCDLELSEAEANHSVRT